MSHPDIHFFSPDDDDDPAFGLVVINGDAVQPSVALEIVKQLREVANFALANAGSGIQSTEEPHVAVQSLLDEARSLLSEDDTNPEYDRALVELTCYALGRNTGDRDEVLAILRQPIGTDLKECK